MDSIPLKEVLYFGMQCARPNCPKGFRKKISDHESSPEELLKPLPNVA
jgi:hypothetical protein